MRISDSIVYVGVFDKDLDLFEGQYAVPMGVSYNSYVILDDKIAVMDSVDSRKTKEWLANLEAALNGKAPDYKPFGNPQGSTPGIPQKQAVNRKKPRSG